MSGSNGTGRPGWFRVNNAIVDEHGAELGPYGLAVYLVLARFANLDGEAWPSKATIAARAGMSKRKVDEALEALEARGLVRITRRRDQAGDPAANLYRLQLPADTRSSIGSFSPESSSGAPGALPPLQDVHHPPAQCAPPPGTGSAPDAPPPNNPPAWCAVLDAARPRMAANDRLILDSARVEDDGERFRITLPAHQVERMRSVAGQLEQIARRQVKLQRTVEVIGV